MVIGGREKIGVVPTASGGTLGALDRGFEGLIFSDNVALPCP